MLFSILISGLLGLLIELLQSLNCFNRTLSLIDALFNLLGAICGACFFRFVVLSTKFKNL